MFHVSSSMGSLFSSWQRDKCCIVRFLSLNGLGRFVFWTRGRMPALSSVGLLISRVQSTPSGEITSGGHPHPPVYPLQQHDWMMSLPLRSEYPVCYLHCWSQASSQWATRLSVFVRLVGKHQVGNLLLAALKGMFTQRLGADFELATRVARMVDSNASYKWQMGNEIFFCFWSVFSLMSSAACSLTGVLLTVLPRLLLSATVGAGERSWAAWHPRVLWAATHSTTFLGPCGAVSQRALLSRSRHKLIFFCFLWEWMLRWHLACCLYWKVLIKSCAWRF